MSFRKNKVFVNETGVCLLKPSLANEGVSPGIRAPRSMFSGSPGKLEVQIHCLTPSRFTDSETWIGTQESEFKQAFQVTLVSSLRAAGPFQPNVLGVCVSWLRGIHCFCLTGW